MNVDTATLPWYGNGMSNVTATIQTEPEGFASYDSVEVTVTAADLDVTIARYLPNSPAGLRNAATAARQETLAVATKRPLDDNETQLASVDLAALRDVSTLLVFLTALNACRDGRWFSTRSVFARR